MGRRKTGGAYSAVDDMLVARVVVDVDCYAAQGRDFGREFVEARVVLPVVVEVGLDIFRFQCSLSLGCGDGVLFALVGLRHRCAGGTGLGEGARREGLR